MAARSRSGEAVALPPIAAAPVVPALPATTGRALDVQIIAPPRAPSDMTDAEIGNAAAACVDQHLAMRSGAIEQAVRAGELLLEARHRCREQSSSWSDWCRRYWPKSRRTADTYMKVAMEVNPEKSGERAPSMTADALLALPSVRALLTSTGHGAGGTRDEPDQIAGMREPGADEDEDANVPTGDMKAPTPAEAAVVDRLAAQQAQSDADRAAERKHRKEEWKAKKRAEEQQAKQQDTAEARAERERLAAEDKVRRAAELADMKRAEDKPTGPDKPRPRPEETQPDGPVSVNDELRALADDAVDAARRMAAISTRLAAIKFAPSEEFDLASGRSDPRLDAMRAAMQAIGAAFHPATVVAEKWAPKLRLLGALDARIVAVELARIEHDEQRARESMAAFAAKRGA